MNGTIANVLGGSSSTSSIKIYSMKLFYDYVSYVQSQGGIILDMEMLRQIFKDGIRDTN